MGETMFLAACLGAHLVYVLKFLSLAEALLEVTALKKGVRLLLGLLYVCVTILLRRVAPINLVYLFAGLFLYAELQVVFRKPLKETVLLCLASILNAISLMGMTFSVLALCLRTSLLGIAGTPMYLFPALILINLLRFLAASMILRKAPMDHLRAALKVKPQTLLLWQVLCVTVLLHSSTVLTREVREPFTLISHLSYNALAFLSFYFVLSYTLRLSSAANIRKINKGLTKVLSNNISLQSALMRDALFVAQANLSQNLVISGLEVYKEAMEDGNMEYDKWFDYVRAKIYPADFDIFAKSLERRNLLKNYEQGIEPKPFEYRRLFPDNSYRWVRLVLRTFLEMESGDVHLFGYAFDIENEVRDRELLLKNAQTDLFTGLYNKATTELIIGEEIRKGAGILLLLDIDNFKSINDCYGHIVGDRALKQVAGLLRDVFRKMDIIGRTGGDEFTIYIKDTTDLGIAEARITELLNSLSDGVLCDNKRIDLTLSAGIAVVDEKIDNFALAYSRADKALYQVKGSGKNGYAIYEGQRDPGSRPKSVG